jgi:cobalt-precorrin-5B (C1)-methyltransferase
MNASPSLLKGNRMQDPVSGFEYPEAWVQRCQNPGLLLLAETGMGILTSSGTVLRRGFTTGTTAAAACKAAVLSLRKGPVHSVIVRIPCGLIVNVPAEGRSGTASSRKFAGDYPGDVTAGIEFIAKAVPGPGGIELISGEGIGRFSRDTPRYRKGDPAISPASLDCILTSIQDALGVTALSGVQVVLSVPAGVEIGQKTLNSRVGVDGGISVLGTTGLVEPWDDHLGSSVIDLIVATENPVLTTGRIGMRYARLLYPDREVILIGGKIAEALAAAKGDVVLFGLPALILNRINPHLLDGTGIGTVEEFVATPASVQIIKDTLAGFRKTHPGVRVVLVNRAGEIIGDST